MEAVSYSGGCWLQWRPFVTVKTVGYSPDWSGGGGGGGGGGGELGGVVIILTGSDLSC